MPRYSVALKASARKELETLPGKLIERVIARLEALEADPRPAGSKKLKGGDREYRVRVGDYRIVYVVDDGARSVSVTRIRHRREVYE